MGGFRTMLARRSPGLLVLFCVATACASDESGGAAGPADQSVQLKDSAGQLSAPHDDTQLCSWFKSDEWAEAFGGERVASVGGSPAAAIADARSNGGIPIVGQCVSSLADDLSVKVFVLDFETADSAAASHAERLSIAGTSPAPTPVSVNGGSFVDTGFAVWGIIGRLGIECGYEYGGLLADTPPWRTDGERTACIAAVQQVAAFVASGEATTSAPATVATGASAPNTIAADTAGSWLDRPLQELDLCQSLSSTTVDSLGGGLGACEPRTEWEGQVAWPGDTFSLSVFVVDSAVWGGETAEQGRNQVEEGNAIEVPLAGSVYAWAFADDDTAVADFGQRLVVVQLNGEPIPIQPSSEDYAALLQEVVAYLDAD